jgi:glycine cleavage system aminomethyltransferase T
VSLAFLTPGAGPDSPPAESPMATGTAAAGALFEVRDGWRVPTGFTQRGAEKAAVDRTVGWADVSHLRKLELQGPAEDLAALAGGLAFGTAVRAHDAWWCLITPDRALVLCELAALDGVREDVASRAAVHALDVTAQYAALRLGGPLARETLARFCALDLRPPLAPPGAFRPGSVARTPGSVLCEATDRYVLLVGAALGEYLWSVVTDAGEALGGRPVGVDHFPAVEAPLEGAGSHA